MRSFLNAYLAFNALYYGFSLLGFICDMVLSSNLKIQKTGKIQMINLYYTVAKTVFYNVSIYSIPFLYGSYYLLNQLDRKFELSIYIVPELILLYLMSDFFFYSMHRWFHIPLLYRYHKVHHEIRSPVGFASLYMHPIDMYFANMLPVALPLFVLSTPLETAYLWTAIVLFDTILIDHSGYKKLSDHHDAHHQFFSGNYGTTPLFDCLFGTTIVRRRPTNVI